MVQRIRVIDGNACVGTVQQTRKGKPKKGPRLMVVIPPLIIIKLPRSKVDAAFRSCGRSLSFSHKAILHEGQPAIIYATGDNGGFHSAYRGVIALVSNRGEREYALAGARQITRSEWNSYEDLSKLTR